MRLWGMGYLACGAAALAFAAPSTAASRERNFDLPSQSANKSLPEFARQAGMQIVAPGANLRTIRTPALKGRYEVRQALETLLRGSGIKIISADDVTIVLGLYRFESKIGRESEAQQPVARQIYASAHEAADPVPAPVQAAAARPSNARSRNRDVFEEIVVTARRRAENIRDVPLTITALSAEDLAERHVTSKVDLANSVPGLINTQTIGAPISSGFAIRGQGPGFSSGAAVITYFAEVPAAGGGGGSQASTAFADGGPGSYYDLENVQVLKGPQGTLFGKNSVGGAVLFTPNKPANGFSADIMGQLGNYNERSVEAMINVPIIEDRVLFRVAGTFEKRDGFTKDVGPFHKGRDYDNVNYRAARASLVLRPVDGFENYTIVRYIRHSLHGQGSSTTIYNPAAPSGLGAPIEVFYPNLEDAVEAQRARGPRRIALNERQFTKYEAWQALNTTTIDILPNLKLKNIASYSHSAHAYGQDGDGTSEPVMGSTSRFRRDQVVEFYTEELQLQGNLMDNALDYVVGVYGDKVKAPHYEADTYLFPLIPGIFPIGPLNNPGYPVFIHGNENAKSRAAFGQATLDVGRLVPTLQGLSLTAGYRRTRESGGGQTVLSTGFGNLGNPGTYKFSYGSHTLTAKYQVNPDLMVYVTQRNAFKSGGVNSYVLDEASPYRFYAPEEAIDIEAGVKARFSLGSMPASLDAAAFKTKIKNVHRQSSDPVIAPVGNFIRSAAEGEVKGFEIAVEVKPAPILELGVNYAYTDTGYTKITDPLQIPLLTGAPFPYVAKHKGDVHMSVQLPIVPESEGTIRLGGNYAFQSKTSNALDNTSPQLFLKGYGLVNLHAEWSNVFGKPLDLGFFMTNVLNKTYQAGQVTQVITFPGMIANGYGAPRMFGFNLRYHFGQ